MNVVLTKHAKKRRKQMGITEDQIEAVLSDPDLIYPGDPAKGNGRSCSVRDGIVVVWKSGSQSGEQVVLTVLWHGKEGR